MHHGYRGGTVYIVAVVIVHGGLYVTVLLAN
jgi:hypothetical protein